jgi:hypothetical protein
MLICVTLKELNNTPMRVMRAVHGLFVAKPECNAVCKNNDVAVLELQLCTVHSEAIRCISVMPFYACTQACGSTQ